MVLNFIVSGQEEFSNEAPGIVIGDGTACHIYMVGRCGDVAFDFGVKLSCPHGVNKLEEGFLHLFLFVLMDTVAYVIQEGCGLVVMADSVNCLVNILCIQCC